MAHAATLRRTLFDLIDKGCPAPELPDIVDTLDEIRPGYVLRLRQHYNFHYDTVLYASPRDGWDPDDTAQ